MGDTSWVDAGLWGLLAGSALLLGTYVGYFASPSARVAAGAMAFASGLLFSAVAFDLMDEAYEHAGLAWSSGGLLFGAVLYSAVNLALVRRGAGHRKRSGHQQPSEDSHPGSGLASALGTLWDGAPEAMAIGLSLLGGGRVEIAAVIAVALSNFPEGLSSAAGMRRARRSKRYVFGVFLAVTLVSGFASIAGYTVVGRCEPEVVAIVLSAAAGAVLAMIVDTMLPEAFAETHEYAGLITAAGFVSAYALAKFAE